MAEKSFVMEIDGFGTRQFVGFGAEVVLDCQTEAGEEFFYAFFEDLQVEEAA